MSKQSRRRRRIKNPVATLPANEVLSYTTSDCPETMKITVGDRVYVVKMRSKRFNCFRRNCKCVNCGCEGTVMGLDMNKEGYVHWNLYAKVKGVLRLMTKDHIVPRSKGGADTQSNFQTMCERCNRTKSNLSFTPAELVEMVELQDGIASLRGKMGALVSKVKSREEEHEHA